MTSTLSKPGSKPKPSPSPKTLRSSRTEITCARYLEKSGWRILHHNIRVARVQIDLLARDPKGLLTVVEVKSRGPLAQISWRQKRRLFQAAQVLAGFERVQMILALVSGTDVLLVPVDGLTV